MVGGGFWSSRLEIVCVSIIRNGEKSCETESVFGCFQCSCHAILVRMYTEFFSGGEGGEPFLFYIQFCSLQMWSTHIYLVLLI